MIYAVESDAPSRWASRSMAACGTRKVRPSRMTGRPSRPLVASARPFRTDKASSSPDTPSPSRPAAAEPSSRLGAANPGQIRRVTNPKGPDGGGVPIPNPAQDRTVSAPNPPGVGGVCTVNPAQERTLSSQTPPEIAPETQPSNARAGREPRNPRTDNHPPDPPEGGVALGQVAQVGHEQGAAPQTDGHHRQLDRELGAVPAQAEKFQPGSHRPGPRAGRDGRPDDRRPA